MIILAQTVTLSWGEGKEMKEMELYDIETDGSGRLDWAAVELTLTADLVEIEGKGRPGVFPSGHREGLTRATFQPGSTIRVSVSHKLKGMAARLLLLAALHGESVRGCIDGENMAGRYALPAIVRGTR